MRTSYHKWTPQELEYLANNYKHTTDSDLAKTLTEMLGVVITTAMIRRQRKKLSISKPKGRQKKTNVH